MPEAGEILGAARGLQRLFGGAALATSDGTVLAAPTRFGAHGKRLTVTSPTRTVEIFLGLHGAIVFDEALISPLCMVVESFHGDGAAFWVVDVKHSAWRPATARVRHSESPVVDATYAALPSVGSLDVDALDRAIASAPSRRVVGQFLTDQKTIVGVGKTLLSMALAAGQIDGSVRCLEIDAATRRQMAIAVAATVERCAGVVEEHCAQRRTLPSWHTKDVLRVLDLDTAPATPTT
jgi:formamidopyrimidine-DNA glycosylase